MLYSLTLLLFAGKVFLPNDGCVFSLFCEVGTTRIVTEELMF